MPKGKSPKSTDSSWKSGSAYDFLNLSAEEIELVEIRLAFSRKMKELRLKSGRTQGQIAKLIHSSQSRVAKIEAGDPSISLDRQIKSLIMLGLTRKQVGKLMAQ